MLRKSSLLLAGIALISSIFPISGQLTPQPAAAEVLDADTIGVTEGFIRIGSCCALTGPASKLGTRQLAGAKAYLSYINDQGGVNGRKIKLLTYDDSYEPEAAEKCFTQMLSDNVFAAAFFVGTPTAARYVPKVEMYKIPVVGLFTGAKFLQEPLKKHVFCVRASYADETKQQVEDLFALNAKKIAIIYQNDAFGAAVLDGVKAALDAKGSKLVALGTFPRNTLDVSAAINAVKGSAADAVIIAGSYAPAAEIIIRCRAQGYKPRFSTVSFVGTEDFIKAGGKQVEGTIITQVMPPINHDELPTVALYKKLLKTYSPTEEPTFAGLEGFVDAMVLVDGLKLAGRDLSRTKFISAMESMRKVDLGLGKLKLTYGPTRHKGFDAVYTTVIRNGHPIEDPDLKGMEASSK